MVFPNLFNAAGALFRWVRALIRREPALVSDEVLEARLATCAACEFFEPESRQCLKCTCLVDIKANLSTEFCPERFWKE